MIITSPGFKETGLEGEKLEKEVAEIAQAGDVRVLGPNCNGVVNVEENFNITGSPSFNQNGGPIALIAQSGFVGASLKIWSWMESYGIGKFISTGNECDLTCADFLEYHGGDSNVKVILLYLEALKSGQSFSSAARKIVPQKPVIVFKVGENEGGQRAVTSHTGRISTSDEIYRVAFEQTGIIRTPSLYWTLSTARCFIEQPLLRGKRIGIITAGGGWGAILSDALERLGLRVPEFPRAVVERLREITKVDNLPVKNPIDAGVTMDFPSVSVIAAELLLSQDLVDGLIVSCLGFYGSHALNKPDLLYKSEEEEQCFRDLADLITQYGKPILFHSPFTSELSLSIKETDRLGKFTFRDENECAFALHALYQRWLNLHSLSESE